MWWHRFVNRFDVYAKQTIVRGTCQYFPQYDLVRPILFDWHLSGSITLGLPAIDQGGLSRWCCFDADKNGDSLSKIATFLSYHHWHYVTEGRRPGREGHLWMFFDIPVLASDLRLFGRRVIELAGIPPGHVEFFPKQDMPSYDEAHGRFKASSIVRLPLGIHQKPEAAGARGWFDGVEKNISKQSEFIAAQPFNPAAALLKFAPELRQLAAAKAALNRHQHNTSLPVDIIRLERALTYLSADKYEEWIEVGMALKAAAMPIEIWERWSTQSSKYKPGQCAYKWSTFNGNSKTLGSIFYLAKQRGFEDLGERFGHFLNSQ